MTDPERKLTAKEQRWLELKCAEHNLNWHQFSRAIKSVLREVLLTVKEDCAGMKRNDAMLPADPDQAHIYKVAWADYARAIRNLDIGEGKC